MNLNKKKLPVIGFLSCTFMLFSICIFGKEASEIYKEKVHLNIGRDCFISGERIWYSAYCLSNMENPFQVYSRVLYVELVNYKKQHILGQILKLKEGRSASCIVIPDTLSSGMYFLKGYTNWMKNFDENRFFSVPVYIYNNYDEDNSTENLAYFFQPEPDVYIKGGDLVHNVQTEIVIHFPGLFGSTISGKLVEIMEDSTIYHQVLIDRTGLARFSLTPQWSSRYSFIFEDSHEETYRINLPEVQYSGYFINIVEANDREITLQVNESGTSIKQVLLKIMKGNETVHSVEIRNNEFQKDLKIPVKGDAHGKMDLALKDNQGKILARQSFILPENNTVCIASSDKEVKSNSKNDFIVYNNNKNSEKVLDVSVGIYKKEPSVNAGVNDLIFLDFNTKYFMDLVGNMYLLYPLISGSGHNDRIDRILTQDNVKYPVEDIGIIYSGKIDNKYEGFDVSGIEAILSIKDTLPDMQSSLTDSEGRFAFLIDKYLNQPGIIDLFGTSSRIKGKFDILPDEKFYYSSHNNGKTSITSYADSRFLHELEDETQRMLIQRAFGNINTDKFDSLINIPYSQVPFYGEPALTVFPDEFFFLPNFSEIIREIVPRARYKAGNSDCEMIVNHIKDGVKSYTPLIILDGLPVSDLCDLQMLNSDDIQRIEVQSGYRIAGNYLYNGLVAIYTSLDYRMNNFQPDERTSYSIPGYTYAPDFSDLINEKADKWERHPDFKNQLYWDPELTLKNNDKSEIEFITTDELGEYIIDIRGFSENGDPVFLKETISVVE
ncbi:MAG: Plug domain-containing protein [Bacteroidales bacterium]|nr:Plug domain-containing protein [Bacteroidales bacterium]